MVLYTSQLAAEINKLKMKILHLEHATRGVATQNEMPTGEKAIPTVLTEAREVESNNDEHSPAVVYRRAPIGPFGPSCRVRHRPHADK